MNDSEHNLSGIPTPAEVEDYGQRRPGALDHRRIGLLSWDELPVKPCQDQVLVKLDPPAQTASGIHIPVSARRRQETVEATVIAVGPGAYDKKGRLMPMDVKAGDRVLVGGDAGWEVGPHRMLRQGAILVALEPGEAPPPAKAREPYWGPELAENLGLTPEEAKEALECL
jgi:chaperonin GroES